MRRILFITGTRADFGKLKPLMLAVESDPAFECHIFVTGMHLLERYGYTADEVHKAGFARIHACPNQEGGEPADLIAANTIAGLSKFVETIHPDLIVVHGDRVETLAAAMVGVLRNILVAHVEGGELSGTVDELIRHAVSKLSHVHFVANSEAAVRLRQLGETDRTVHIIGSPEVDVMLSPALPALEAVRERYRVPFENYGIVLFHPVTTEPAQMRANAECLVSTLLESNWNLVVVYPNNDHGSEHIFAAYKALENIPRIRLVPSMRFEYFLSLLKHAAFIIGNSSAGVREAPVFPVPSVNLGTRQQDRHQHSSIINADFSREEILAAITKAVSAPAVPRALSFGDGSSAGRFLAILRGDALWSTAIQKRFFDLPAPGHAPAVAAASGNIQ